MVKLQIKRAAQARAQIILQSANRERAVEAVEQIVDFDAARAAGQNTEAERCARFHKVFSVADICADRSCNSNSVQSFSERSNFNSPPCKRARSRARLRPSPWPATVVPLLS